MTVQEANESGYLLYPPRPARWRGRKTLLSSLAVFAFLAILPWFPILGLITSVFDTDTAFGQGNVAFVFAFTAAAIGFNLLHWADIDGDTARAGCYFTGHAYRQGTPGGDHFSMGGRYDDELERTDHGWRITKRTLTLLWADGNEEVRFPVAGIRDQGD